MAEPLDSSGRVGAGVPDPVPGRPRHGRLDDGLPHDLSSFVGRERELSDVVALIERARLVTLTGPGGSGKTRLAIEAARRAASALNLEAAFVDLAPVGDPGLIVVVDRRRPRHPPRTVQDGRRSPTSGPRRSLPAAGRRQPRAAAP